MKRILPSYPLFVKDPNFSLWSPSEKLNESNIQTWFKAEKKLYGFLKTNKKTYCFMGNASDFIGYGVCPAKQLDLKVEAFSTEYVFKAGKAKLKIRFVSPLPPDDLELISLPVTYAEYQVEGVEQAEISLFINEKVSYNDIRENANKSVRGGVMVLDGFETAFLGLKRQLPLSNNDDWIGADWGYWYVAGESAYYTDYAGLGAYLLGNVKDFSAGGEEKFISAIDTRKQGVICLGYDDVVSIDYFGEFLKGYYLQDHTILDGLRYTWSHHKEINAKLEKFAVELYKKSEKYGEKYQRILNASLRQSVAAHKLVKDRDGNVLFLSKECASNGCIATVDVSYPSIPLYLPYNTELIKGMMRPILKFAKMPVWKYDFAPHDAGTYPACCGQTYSMNQTKTRFHGNLRKTAYGETHFPVYLLPATFDAYNLERQMPVEECANMLIMFYACYKFDGDISFFENELQLTEKWVEYLVKYGLKPENQLCTDDFAGHLKNNINLSVKATVGIASYAGLMQACGKQEEGRKYRLIAENFAGEIVAFANQFPHMPITWDTGEETFSLKYNFAFDKVLSLGLFPQSLFESETDYYVKKCQKYGTPLDHRESYTKSDWLMWAASLTEDGVKRQKFISALEAFLRETPDRVPFNDWYYTETGKRRNFQARSVVGGHFILLLNG
ncbi:MAG: glutaminase domain-containing protein [Candidatus Scatosoma sp.]